MTIKVKVNGPVSRESTIEINDINELMDMEFILGWKVTYDANLNSWYIETK